MSIKCWIASLIFIIVCVELVAQVAGSPLSIKDGTSSVIQQNNLTLRYDNLKALFENYPDAANEIRSARTYGGYATVLLSGGGGLLSYSVISNFTSANDPIPANSSASTEFNKRKDRQKIMAIIGIGCLAIGASFTAIKRNKRRNAVNLFNSQLEGADKVYIELDLNLNSNGLELSYSF